MDWGMKTLFRLFFRRRQIAPPESPLFRFYLNEFNAPKQVRQSESVYL